MSAAEPPLKNELDTATPAQVVALHLEDGQVRFPATSPPSLRQNRVAGALMALPALGLLGVSAWLVPSGTGMETHRQLGLPACGMYQGSGRPCPTCGMTTAFAHAAHGDLLESFITQPAGCLLAIACAMLVLIGGWSAYSGMNGAKLVGRVLARKRVWLAWVAWVLLAWGWTLWRHGA